MGGSITERFKCKNCGRLTDAVPAVCACGNANPAFWDKLPEAAAAPAAGRTEAPPSAQTPSYRPGTLSPKQKRFLALLCVLLALAGTCTGALGYIAFNNRAHKTAGSADRDTDGQKKRDQKDGEDTASPDGSAPSAPDALSTSETASPGESIATFTVPDFRGKEYDALLRNRDYTANLQFAKAEAHSDTVPRGQVIEQSIAPGANVPTGTQITLTVSKGPSEFPLPDVTGKRFETAEEELKQLDLKCKKEIAPNHGDAEAGTVKATEPAAGTVVREDFTVRVYVWGESSVEIPPLPDTAVRPDKMSKQELLAFFNKSLNRIKTDKVGFQKTGQTSYDDLQFSEPKAGDIVKTKWKAVYSFDKPRVTAVKKGISSDNKFSPAGKPYVSQLQLEDLKYLNCDRSGNDYVITLAVKEETNPAATDSIMSRCFDFLTVDEVIDIYAPKVKAEVKRENVRISYSNCTAKLIVTADGQVTAYETAVNCVLKITDAEIGSHNLRTDMTVTLTDTAAYSDFDY